MKISDLFTMIGGLAFFLYGMHLLGEALAKASGSKMEALLAKMTNNPLKGVLLGACITAVIQSSSATTVMVVGFVNSGLMQLEQAVGMIMGANIGTTITSWLLSLAGIEDGHTILTLFKPETFLRFSQWPASFSLWPARLKKRRMQAVFYWDFPF